MSAPATLTEAQRREAWLKDRRTGIGGSEVAAIVLPPEDRPSWCSPLKLWLEKRGLAETAENNAMRAGKRFERSILELYAETRGVAIAFADPWEFIRDKHLPILGASLDARWAEGDRRPVDAKNIRFKDGTKFGECGTDRIPLYYACQLAVQAMVTDSPCADLAPLFSGQDMEWFTVHRDLETEAIIRERVAVWWERHIVQDIPPDPDGSDSSSRYLAQRFARHGAELLQPTPEQLDLARQLARVKAEAKRVEAEQARLENLLKLGIGGAAGLQGICTWKCSASSAKVDWEAVAKSFNPSPDLISTHTTTKPGTRRFLLTLKEE